MVNVDNSGLAGTRQAAQSLPPQKGRESNHPAKESTTIDLLVNQTVRVGDVPFVVTTLDEAVNWILAPSIDHGGTSEKGVSVRLANAYCVAQAHQDSSYRSLLQSGGINLPDGTPILWTMLLARARAGGQPGRVRGPSLFRKSLLSQTSFEARHFLLGGTESILDEITKIAAASNPNCKIVGRLAPDFGPLTEHNLLNWSELINNSGATVVWVSLGSPKQDFATSRLAELTGAKCVGVGAAFDFMAGTQKEAPTWIQQSALEWLYRLLTQPRRLWRRYLFGNLQFIKAIVKPHGSNE